MCQHGSCTCRLWGPSGGHTASLLSCSLRKECSPGVCPSSRSHPCQNCHLSHCCEPGQLLGGGQACMFCSMCLARLRLPQSSFRFTNWRHILPVPGSTPGTSEVTPKLRSVTLRAIARSAIIMLPTSSQFSGTTYLGRQCTGHCV